MNNSERLGFVLSTVAFAVGLFAVDGFLHGFDHATDAHRLGSDAALSLFTSCLVYTGRAFISGKK